jgi:four helix bundle protein
VAGVRRYEDLICWRLSYELQQEVFAKTATGPAVSDVKFCDQIRESSRSATRNIAEGFGRYAPAEFRRFLRIARGSLLETHHHLRDGHDRKYFDTGTHDRLSRLALRAAKAVSGLMNYLEDCKRKNTSRTP